MRRRRTRKHLDILKQLLRDESFKHEKDRVVEWMQITCRTRSRYYALLPLAWKEIDEEDYREMR